MWWWTVGHLAFRALYKVDPASRFDPATDRCTFAEAFALPLGPTDPRTNAVHAETFSITVFKRSHLNIRYYHQDLH